MSVVRPMQGTLPCGCALDSRGAPFALCREAAARQQHFHDAIRDWAGRHSDDLRIAQTGQEFFAHFKQEKP